MHQRRLFIRLSVFLFLILGVFLVTSCADSRTASKNIDEQAPRDGFGAIAFSDTTQRWHIRWNVPDQTKADSLAIQYCGWKDCAVILRFGPGACGTFSLGDNGALGIGLGATGESTKAAALADCARSGQSCKAAPVRCNDKL